LSKFSCREDESTAIEAEKIRDNRNSTPVYTPNFLYCIPAAKSPEAKRENTPTNLPKITALVTIVPKYGDLSRPNTPNCRRTRASKESEIRKRVKK
jgi:hypothetical protein